MDYINEVLQFCLYHLQILLSFPPFLLLKEKATKHGRLVPSSFNTTLTIACIRRETVPACGSHATPAATAKCGEDGTRSACMAH